MNRLTREKRILTARCLTEGMGVNATSRTSGASKNTVLKLLADLGNACLDFQARTLRDLSCKRLQADELWGFCGLKQKNVPAELKGVWGLGDVWTWVAIDAETKLVPTWLVAPRDADAAEAFMADLASRLRGRVQLTTDGLSTYVEAVEGAFGSEIDYSQLVKLYGESPEGKGQERKYSPGECCGTRKSSVSGTPDPKHVSTSYSERLNLTIRQTNKRLARLTNSFSRKVENLQHSMALGFCVYNFVKIHGSLRVTPAMAARVTDRLWDYGDIIDLLEAGEESAADVGARRKDRQAVD